MDISPELSFAIACCRANFAGPERALDAADVQLDWARLARLARFHRIEGLVWEALASSGRVPDADELKGLREAAGGIAAANLRALAECRGLRDDFDRAGVPLLFLKGLSLGAIAYRSAMLKSAADVDLLVRADQLGAAVGLLERRGFVLVEPNGRPSENRLQRWHRRRKESQWSQPRSGVSVDLHTRLADNPRLIPSLGIGSPVQRVPVANGIVLPTLAPDELFAYLAVHGASSAWFRLKWVSDFAALLSGRSGEEIDRLYRRSQVLGAGRAAAQALLVADRLFGLLDAAPRLRSELMTDRSSRRLLGAALRQLVGRSEPVEPTSAWLGTARIHWTQFLLLPGVGFKLSELARQVQAMRA